MVPVRFLGLAILALAVGCSHEAPFTADDHSTRRPFLPGPPAVLTANRGRDGDPAGLPDGSGYIYSFDSWYEPGDACLGVLPRGASRVSREICPATDRLSDDRYSLPTVSAGGRVAFLLTRRNHGVGAGPYYSALVTAPMGDIRDTSEIRPVPLVTPDGILHMQVTRLAWFRGDTVAFLASARLYLVDTRGPARAIISVDLPATVADIHRDGNRFFLSLAGSSRLFRLDPDTRALVPVHDFTPAGSLGLIQVAGAHALALTDGGLYLADLTAHSQVSIPAWQRSLDRIAWVRGDDRFLAESPDPATGLADLVAYRLP